MTTRPRAPRSDGAQNRERILEAARAAFADSDTEVSMAELARLAGLGSGTLYRHFASRRDLLEVLYINEVDAVCAAAADTGPSGDRFLTWLRQFFDFVTSKRHVATELLEHTDRSDPVFTGSRDRVVAAAKPLFDAAQQSGQVDTRLDVDQILDMVVAIAKIKGGPEYVLPILDVTLRTLGDSSSKASLTR